MISLGKFYYYHSNIMSFKDCVLILTDFKDKFLEI